jgi:GTPase SAR1 family protein
MKYPLKERIGAFELFTNRQEELDYFDAWIRDIEKEAGLSTAIVSHRKVGKTALLQRLYNELFVRNGKVIPFFYEIKEQEYLLEDFARLYYTSFISQLLSFKKRQWIETTYSLGELKEISAELKLDYVTRDVGRWLDLSKNGGASLMWTFTNEAPHRIAERTGDFILVMIDEFQYLNKYIYQAWPGNDGAKQIDLAGSYLGTSESKIAPMLITGSAVGMLIRLIYRQLPRRFKFYRLTKFKPQDFLELGYKLSSIYGVPVTDECLLLAHRLLDGHPAYLRDIFNSTYPGKDLTTPEGLNETYLFETSEPNVGRILAGWEEYLDLAFHEINEFNAKKIVLFLAKHNDREWSRKEIREKCGLHEMSDQELDRKLKALVLGDLIAKGRTAIHYRGLGDPTFEKVFRIQYEQEIEETDFETMRQDMLTELRAKYGQLKAELASKSKEVHKVRGAMNQKKGEAGELWIRSVLRRYSQTGKTFAPGELGNNAEPVVLPVFQEIDAYTFSHRGRKIEIDVLCQPEADSEPYLVAEVKNRDAKKVSVKEVERFAANLRVFQEHRKGAKVQGLFYSFNGFQAGAIEKLDALGIYRWDFETLETLS